MNDASSPSEPSDPIFDRLRDADPAAGAEPDLSALDAAVRARIAEPPDEVAAARSRRGLASWWPLAAVAASALVFGTAGFALGTGGGGGERAGTSTAGAAITLSQPGSSGPVAPEAAMGAADSKQSSSLVAPWYGGGRTVFTAVGLSDAGGSAEAWTFDPAQTFTAETATRLAQALGLDGTAVLTDGAWTVGPTDGTGPSLQLQPDGLGSVSYYNPGLDPYACEKAGVQSVEPGAGPAVAPDSAGSSGSTSSDGSTTAPEVMPLPQPPQTCTNAAIGDAPQGDAAVAKARDLVGALGLDAGAFEYETSDSGMPQYASVSAYQVLGGQRTGVTWSVSLVGAGVQSLYGSVAPLVSLGTYDVVSPADAVARLSDPRFGPSYGGPMMYAAAKGAVAQDGVATQGQTSTSVAPDAAQPPSRSVPTTAQPGSPIAWPVTEVSLTSARLGLTLTTQPDGSSLLLPAYELTSDDGQIWSAVAVADAQLDFAPVG